MRNRVLLAASAISVLAAAPAAFAQANPRGEAKAVVGGKAVAIEYGRPSLKGRDMLAQAEVGAPWRLGADTATSLKTEADLSFGDVSVPAGAYVLRATRAAENRWVLNVFGRDAATSRATDKVADVPLTMSKLDQEVETFTIELSAEKEAGQLSISWGKTALKASFTAR